MQDKLNFTFWGTPDVASDTLEILKGAGFLPSLIITAPDKPKGRKLLVAPPPVKVWAQNNNVPFMQPENLNLEDFSEEKMMDFSLVVAYGKIIPEVILNLPKFGSINVHYSLLPKYRGASPVETAILNGDPETGVTIQKMAYEMDAGNILAQEKTEILPEETAPELRKRLIKLGAELLIKILPDFAIGKLKPVPQDESRATYSHKIKKEDGLIDLNNDPVKNYNRFRAYAHWPRTFFLARRSLGGGGFKDGKRKIITDASLENGKFVIKKIIPEGGKEVEYKN